MTGRAVAKHPNQHTHKTLRQFDLSARSADAAAMAVFARLDRLLRQRLSALGQEGERTLRGERQRTGGGPNSEITRSFYADISPDEARAVETALNDVLMDEHGALPSNVGVALAEADFSTGVNVLNDTKHLKELADFVKSNGGEFSYRKGEGGSATTTWSLPSDLKAAGAKGKPVSAVASLRRRFAALSAAHLDKYRKMMKDSAELDISRDDVKNMSAERRAALAKNAKKVAEAKAQTKEGFDRDDYWEATLAALDKRETALRMKQELPLDVTRWPRLSKARQEQQLRATPGAAEFSQAEQAKHRLAEARWKESVAWAKKNRRNPRAKAILRQNRRRRRPRSMVAEGLKQANKRLGASLRNAGRTARRFALGAISVLLASAVKFLSGLPGLASDVRQMAARGAGLALTDASLRGFRYMERVAGMQEGSFAQVFGALAGSMPDIRTGNSRGPELIRIVAPIATRDPLDRSVELLKTYMISGGDSSELFKALFNTGARLAYANVGKLGDKAPFARAWAENFRSLDAAAPGLFNVSSGISAYIGTLPEGLQEQIRKVGLGEEVVIKGVSIAAGEVWDAVRTAAGATDEGYKKMDPATTVEWKAAEDVAKTWRDLAATFKTIREGVLANILGATESIAATVLNIARAVLSWRGWNGRFAGTVAAMDANIHQGNIEARSSLQTQAQGADASVAALGRHLGIDTKEAQAEAFAAWERGEGTPEHIQAAGNTEAYRAFINALYDQKTVSGLLKQANKETAFYTEKRKVDEKDPTKTIAYTPGAVKAVVNWRPAQTAVTAANEAADANYKFTRAQDQLIKEWIEGGSSGLAHIRVDRYYQERLREEQTELTRLRGLSAKADGTVSGEDLERQAKEQERAYLNLKSEAEEFERRFSNLTPKERAKYGEGAEMTLRYYKIRAQEALSELRRLSEMPAGSDGAISKEDLERRTQERLESYSSVATEHESFLRYLSELKPGDLAAREAVVEATRERAESLERLAAESLVAGRDVYAFQKGEAAKKARKAYEDAKAELARYRNALASLIVNNKDAVATFDETGRMDLSGPVAYTKLPEWASVGAAALANDTARKDFQIYGLVGKQIVEMLNARATEAVVAGVLDGAITVSGKITADNPTWTLHLLDQRTGQTSVIEHIPNTAQQEVDVTIALNAYLGRHRPVERYEQPAEEGGR